MDIIIWSPLNTSGYNIDLEKDKKWIDRRCEILNQFVIPSLEYQTDQDFMWFLEIREDTYDMIIPQLNLNKVPVKIITRPIVYNWKTGAGDAWERQNEDIKKFVNKKTFYDIRLNSDDMYRKDFVEKIKKVKVKKDTQAIIPIKGYQWYLNKNIVVEKDLDSPPFYAFIYNTKDYLNGVRYKTRKGHVGVKRLRNVKMDERLWCWIVHDVNQKIIRKGGYPSYKKYKQTSNEVLNDFLPTQN